MPRYPFYHWVRTLQDRTHQKTPLPIARKINLVGQNKPIVLRETKISNHAYKNSEKNQILFIDNVDHKPTIHRISTNTPQKVLHRIDLQEDRGELCIENQREKKPSR